MVVCGCGLEMEVGGESSDNGMVVEERKKNRGLCIFPIPRKEGRCEGGEI